MPPTPFSIENLIDRTTAERDRAGRVAILLAFHAAAFGALIAFESGPVAQAAFVLTWGLLNFFWLFLLRRPVMSAALSLAMIVILIILSQFKHSVLLMTSTFVDLMVVDLATFSFLLTIIPGLAWQVGLAVAGSVAALVLIWRLEPFRARRRDAFAGWVLCLSGLIGLSFAVPTDREAEFWDHQYVSKFARSTAVAIVDLLTRGVLEADASVSGRLDLNEVWPCPPATKLPHIVMVFDESSFDATMMPGVKVPPDYRERFRSSDGKTRSFLVEGAGGPSWFTEYNVLAGLSVRSYGRFAEAVTRIATGRVNRGLPFALRRCGYKTYSHYSWLGAFVGARDFQTSVGIEHFHDAEKLKPGPAETDRFFYDHANRVIRQERGNGPLFVFVYLAMNHFSWHYRYRPDLLPAWKGFDNGFQIDEYLRRQQISADEYKRFKQQLAHQYPNEKFLLVRFGDHQPLFAKHFLEPGLDAAKVAQRIMQFNLRYFTTYYAVEWLNFQPADLSSALDQLDAPYLPLVVLEAAGVPLDSSFREQKKILQRCNGLFYLCADGAEARRFNRLLIDAGLLEF